MFGGRREVFVWILCQQLIFNFNLIQVFCLWLASRNLASAFAYIICPTQCGQTALIAAASNGDISCVHLLLESGAELESADYVRLFSNISISRFQSIFCLLVESCWRLSYQIEFWVFRPYITAKMCKSVIPILLLFVLLIIHATSALSMFTFWDRSQFPFELYAGPFAVLHLTTFSLVPFTLTLSCMNVGGWWLLSAGRRHGAEFCLSVRPYWLCATAFGVWGQFRHQGQCADHHSYVVFTHSK